MLQTFWRDVINLYAVSRCVTGRISICYLRIAVKTMADLLRRGGVSIPTETRCGQDAGIAATQATKAFTHSLLFPTPSPIILEADRGAALAADSSVRLQELASWRGQRDFFFLIFAF